MSEKNNLTNEVLLADLMIRVTALEKILIKNKVLATEELNEEINLLANQVADVLLKASIADSETSNKN